MYTPVWVPISLFAGRLPQRYSLRLRRWQLERQLEQQRSDEEKEQVTKLTLAKVRTCSRQVVNRMWFSNARMEPWSAFSMEAACS
jgi:hypothetical protein